MNTAQQRDGLAEALGRVVADLKSEWRKDVDLIRAEGRVVVAELKATIVTLQAELRSVHEQDRQRIADAIAKVKDGERGPAGEKGERGEAGAQGEGGEKGDVGASGQDGAPGERGLPGEKGDVGAGGERGEKGESGDRGEAGAAGERGLPGEKGDVGAGGERGEKGEPGELGEIGLQGKDGPEGKPGHDGRDGLPGLSGRDGEPGKDGLSGLNGKDGFSLEDFSASSEDDGRLIVLTFARGDLVVKREIKTAVVLDRGVYRPGKYLKGDGVTFGGSFFIAQQDTETKPETGSDWRLAVKRGRDGKDGQPGEKGERGLQGLPGTDRR